MAPDHIQRALSRVSIPAPLRAVYRSVLAGQRLGPAQGLLLYQRAELGALGLLSSYLCHRRHGDTVYYNQNYHIEPTNRCVYRCAFCSFRRDAGQEGGWELSLEQIERVALSLAGTPLTEVHVTGGVHPEWDLNHYGAIIATIKRALPHVHVKAFSAVELDHIFRKAGVTPVEGIARLKEFGLNSIPGGGAEIADPELRARICGAKVSWAQWLAIHQAAHANGLKSNATMLYGHMESYAQRVQHMHQLRDLQDRTGGFSCFIPLRFRAGHNALGHLGEVSPVEDMRNFAVSRIYLDNIPHLKAYWPMLGRENTGLALGFGANDVDGTIGQSTSIYSMAGAEEQSPAMSVAELCAMVLQAGRRPCERDSLYNPIGQR